MRVSKYVSVSVCMILRCGADESQVDTSLSFLCCNIDTRCQGYDSGIQTLIPYKYGQKVPHVIDLVQLAVRVSL